MIKFHYQVRVSLNQSEVTLDFSLNVKFSDGWKKGLV